MSGTIYGAQTISSLLEYQVTAAQADFDADTAEWQARGAEAQAQEVYAPVSYTHLTLPTILLV